MAYKFSIQKVKVTAKTAPTPKPHVMASKRAISAAKEHHRLVQVGNKFFSDFW